MKNHEANCATPGPSDRTLSVVVPAYNEEEALPEFHGRMSSVLALLPIRAEIIFVNDGSTDRTLEILHQLRSSDRRVAITDLSRKFGKEIVLTADLDYAQGDAVVVIDADLQDPPELILDFMNRWKNGYDVVYAKRVKKQGESFVKKTTAYFFYQAIQRVSPVKIPEDTGDFRLLSRRAVDALNGMREHHRFMKGLFAWIGFPQTAVQYEREPRFAGTTKWNYWKLWTFAVEGFTSFTIAPLKLAIYTGIMIALVAFIYMVAIIYKTLMFGDPVRGYPSLMVVILFLGGLQLISLGIIGE